MPACAPCAGSNASPVQKAQTLVRYSLERVSTRTRSPTFTNSGTCTTTPVSSVAGFVPLEAGIGIRDFQVHVRGRLDAHDLPVRSEHVNRAALDHVAGGLAHGVGGDGGLLVGVRVHE